MNRSRWAWLAALAVLAAALVVFNLPSRQGAVVAEAVSAAMESVNTGAVETNSAEAAEAASTEAVDPAQWVSDAPTGFNPGEQLPDFDLACMDGSTFTLSEYRGRVVIINLWATWCAPCVAELPHFDRLQAEHPDDVAVLAIHSNLITDDVAGFLSDKDYGLDFAVDETGDVIAAVNGSTMLPQTVVIDRYGVVTYNKVGSVSYEALSQLLEEASAQ